MKQIIKKELILLKDLGMKYPTEKSKQKKRYGLYRCYCGKEFETQTSSVKSGKASSCGCNRIKHNLSNHKVYRAWANMIQRCTNSKHTLYENYGERGITVCNEWKNDFMSFYNWSIENGYKDSLTIDRIDVNGNYEPSNCRWTTQSVQQRNTRLLRSTNSSGYRGVSWYKVSKKWLSQITVYSKTIYIGSFDTAIDGAVAYDKYIIDNNLEHTLNFK